MFDVQLDAMRPEDWPTVAEIYRQGIATGNATFETEVPAWEHWNARYLDTCRFVVRRDDAVLAFAALSAVSSRAVYKGVVEHSIYVAEAARGHGIGRFLLQGLIEASECSGIWTIQSSIFPENAATRALHQACGFREVGYRERIACLNGIWRDTVLIERRSKVVGV